jgi:signal transduction histidine kinase
MTPTATRRLNIAVVVATACVVGLLLVSFQVPNSVRLHSTDLTGAWKAHDGTVDDALGSPSLDDSAWVEVRLPGSLPVHAATAEFWVRRWVDVPEAARDEDHLLVLGGTRASFIRAYVNGHFIGEIGDRSQRLKDDSTSLVGLEVSRELLGQERALVALQVLSTIHDWNGIGDQRFLFGPTKVVRPFLIRATMVETLITVSPVLLSIFLFFLVGVLGFIEGQRGERTKYVNVMLVIAACLFWHLSRTGILLSVDVIRRRELNYFAAIAVLLASVELIEHHYLARVTRFRCANRVLAAILLLTPVVPREYLFIVNPMVFTLMAFPSVYLLFLALRSLARGPTGLGVLLDMGALVMTAAGGADLLALVGIATPPLLFQVSLNGLALVSATLVIGDFIQISQRNRVLSSSLAVTNSDLSAALLRAQESTRLKAELLATVSHELRTPLNSIINVPEGLLEDFEQSSVLRCSQCGTEVAQAVVGAPGAEQPCSCCQATGTLSAQPHTTFTGDATRTARFLGGIRDSGRHLLSVVNDLLDYSKLNASQFALLLEPITLAPFLESLRDTIEPLARAQQLRIEFPSSLPPRVLRADPQRLRQILINLLGNAIKFSKPGGVVKLQVEVAGDEMLMHVIDEGIGIAKESHRLIFESFRQIEGGHTRKFGGTGLGLSIAKELATLHGGTITVDSALGVGSTFTVRLPLAGPLETTVRAAPTLRSASDAQRTIVIVEDDPLTLETIKLALRPLGCTLVGTTDAVSAHSLIRQLKPDLIILDVMLAGVSGIELLRQLRAEPATRELRAVVTSAAHANRQPALAPRRRLGAKAVAGHRAHGLSRPTAQDGARS